MVTQRPIHVKVLTERDAMAAIEAVREDGVPREIERDGEIVAVVTPAPSKRPDWRPSHQAIEHTLAAAGSWKEFPELSDLAERIHKWREESPPSEPVTW